MSPRRFSSPPDQAVLKTVRRIWVSIGAQIREERLRRRWSIRDLAAAAEVSPAAAYQLEAGESASLQMAARLTTALGLRLEVDLVDPKKRGGRLDRQLDVIHSLMGEVEAARLRPYGFPVGLDEPYQHYQFSGRADVVAWDLAARALLHLENRTRFPDFQEMAGSFNAKRAYLGRAIAERAGVRRWASETHVLVALWSSEVLHALRLRPESFRSLCPDPSDAFAAWWSGAAPAAAGSVSTLVVLDPLATSRQRLLIGLDDALSTARPRHRDYADAVQKLKKV